MTQFNSNYNYEGAVSFRTYLTRTFAIMAGGLALSGIVAYLCLTQFFMFILNNPMVLTIAIVAELGIAIYFSARLMKMSREMAWTCYILYAILTGFTLSSVLLYYAYASVITAFISTAVLFICMAVIGHNTRFDLSKLSTYLFGGLIAIIISSLINSLLFRSIAVDYFVSVIGVIIFLVIIAFDVQKLQRYYDQASYDVELGEKIMIMGAFQLYLDFINIFIRVLQIFGRRRD